MKLLSKISLLAIGLCLVLSLQAQTNDQLPPKREFRCSWLTTVWAIDWPNPHNASTASQQQKQKESLYALVDSLAEANMNAVFFQVRGFSDAMYNSKYEPWSQYLTGTRGKAPNYDPLQLIIEYAHYKGIEVHAWLNPYRYASSDATYGKNDPKDYHNTHPEWLVDCGGITILNPSLPEVREQICKVVADIVENYDVDGIIFDDYFHQDGYKNEYDDVQYQANSNGMSRADWRRAQNNLMVSMVNSTIKSIKPWVKFGIGPAGVAGKANTSAPVYGVEPCPSPSSDWQYNGIYADPLAWYNEHTIDYMAPQIYWTINSTSNYDLLSHWWSDMACHFSRHMYVSHSLSALKPNGSSLSSGQFHMDEIGAQTELNRKYDRMDAPGSCWYGLSTGLNTKGFIQYIKNEVNPRPAVVPQMTWYRTDDCIYVSNIRKEGNRLQWDVPAGNLRYAVYYLPLNQIGQHGAVASSAYLLGTTYTASFEVAGEWADGVYAVAVLDRYGNEYPARTMGNTSWGKSAAAQLEYPANNDNVLIPCYFSWNAAPEADSYFFQFSRSADFSTVDYECEVADTTFYVGKIYWLKSNETYYWRVRTRSINKEDTYSDIRSFTGSLFNMVSPVVGDTVQSLTPTLVCDSVANPDAKYTFEIATAQSFAEEDIVFSGEATAPRLTVPESVLMASRNYFVRATVCFDKAVVTSEVVKFRTLALPVPIPVITTPTMGETISASSVTVKWQQQQSSGFQIEFSQSASFPGRSTKKYRVDAYTYEYTYDNIAMGTWYVRVAAMKEGGLTDYSEVVSFVMQTPSAVVDVQMSNQPVKMVEDGQVFIYRNGKRYNILGGILQ